QRHAQDSCPHDGHARTRSNRHRRAAYDIDGRRGRQRRFQRPGHSRAGAPPDPTTRAGRHRERREVHMKNFTYYQPTTAADAAGLLEAQWGRTELLAGGTDLLDLQKEYVAQPERVISLAGVRSDLYDDRDPASTRFGNITRAADGSSYGIGAMVKL